jgi:Tfp pilus assembly protein PilN
LDELATHTPERLWLTGLTTKGNSIQLEGESLDNELVAVFLRALGDSPYFDQVDLDSTQLGKGAGGLKVVSFSIRAVMVAPKPVAEG